MLSVKSILLSLLLTAGINAGGEGGDGGGGYTQWFTTTCWETKSAEPVYVTVWQTQWEKPESVTVYNTVVTTETKTTTVVSVETDVVTTTETIYNTVNNYYTDTATQTQIQTQVQTEVQTEVQVSRETATATATATATVISASVFVTTEFATVTDTVTEFPVCTTSSLVGLVLCPTRTINPTYTPPTALPSDWLWGCPPGTLCTPKQIDCNFEPNVPADTYFCSPDECKVPPPLPPLDTSWDPHNCTPYIPPPGYANVAPPIFDLGYDIFQFNGQPGPSCPTTSTTWEDWVAPAPTSSWVDWVAPPPPASSSWVDWVAPSPPVSSSWADWSVSSPPAPPASTWSDWAVSSPPAPQASSWGDWNGPGGQSYSQSWGPAPPGITPRANLVERQANYLVPSGCYNPCNAALLNAQSCQFVGSELCPSSGAFSLQYEDCGACIVAYKTVEFTEQTVLLPSLVPFKNFCTTFLRAAAEVTTSTSTSTTSSQSVSSTSSSTSSSSTTSSSTATVTTTSTLSISSSSSSTVSVTTTTSSSSSTVSVAITTTSSSSVTSSTTITTGTTTVNSTASVVVSPFPGAATLEGRTANSLLLAIFVALSLVFNIGAA